MPRLAAAASRAELRTAEQRRDAERRLAHSERMAAMGLLGFRTI